MNNNLQKPKFSVEFLEEAAEFLELLDEKVRVKIIYNITKSRYSNDKELFKKLNDEIWEFRTLYKNIQYRLFAFWDKRVSTETLIVCTHGIIKKSEKTPQDDLNKAASLRKLYFILNTPKNE
ncbi:Phage-related protein [Daejeonella rubra]|uniref:Phage-related protein n=1 Tax=Daejeonella rubra TaxID=990371 RepID=A0A1G9V2K8_9SPHI|nr:type II toxin-antitoxin system RelE/ParE family toxin [Daejeonella rubra]SDM66462.1 Phage-related protein [Daejeonella rubra]